MRPYALVCLPIGFTMLSLCCSHAFPMLPLSSSCASHALLCFCIALPIFLCYFVWTKIATPAFEYCRRAFCECPAIQKPRGNLHGLADGLWVSCRSPPYAFPTLFSTFFCDASPCFHDAYPLLFLCLPYTLFLGIPPDKKNVPTRHVTMKRGGQRDPSTGGFSSVSVESCRQDSEFLLLDLLQRLSGNTFSPASATWEIAGRLERCAARTRSEFRFGLTIPPEVPQSTRFSFELLHSACRQARRGGGVY